MKRLALLAVAAVMSLTLSGCITDSQNTYGEADVGHVTEVEYGKVIKMRHVLVQGRNTGAGTLVGGAAGAGIGNAVASGGGRPAGAIIGLVAGLVAGTAAENQMQKQNGIEYTIVTHEGRTLMIVQVPAKDDEPIHVGQRIVIQTRGHYQRVLPADDLPDTVKRPKAMRVED
jgi:outer membrane lipoprotein SlyB